MHGTSKTMKEATLNAANFEKLADIFQGINRLLDGLCWGGVEPGHTYEIGDRSPLQTLSFALCLLDHLFSDRGGNGKQGANKRFHG